MAYMVLTGEAELQLYCQDRADGDLLLMACTFAEQDGWMLTHVVPETEGYKVRYIFHRPG